MNEKSVNSVLRKILKASLIKLKLIWISSTIISSIKKLVMNEQNNSKNLIGIMNSEKEYYDLLTEIDYSILEIEIARNIFNNTEESKLIEVAIYLEKASMNRLDYLLSLAKDKCISVSNEYIARKSLEFTQIQGQNNKAYE